MANPVCGIGRGIDREEEQGGTFVPGSMSEGGGRYTKKHLVQNRVNKKVHHG